MIHKTTELFVAVGFLFFWPRQAPADTKSQGCDPDDKSKWEWVFHYPQENQKGQVLKLSHEALMSRENLRPGYESWLSGRMLGILNTPDLPEAVSEFTIYRDCRDAARVSVVEPQPKTFDPGSKRPSKKRMVLSSAIGLGPIGLGILTGGAAVLPYMISGLPNMFLGSGRGRTGDSHKTIEPNYEFRPYELHPGVKVRTRHGYSEAKID